MDEIKEAMLSFINNAGNMPLPSTFEANVPGHITSKTSLNGEVCYVTVSTVDYMPGPIYVLYGVGGMYQNILFYKEDAPFSWLRNASNAQVYKID